MQEVKRMMDWLRTYPGWREEWTLTPDRLDGNRQNGGLFSQGVEITKVRRDVAGNVQTDCRCRFLLEAAVPEQDEQAAQQLLDFTQWVAEQNMLGTCPRFGQEPGREQMTAEKGRLLKIPRPGVKIYQVELTAQYTKFYEVMEHGKN